MEISTHIHNTRTRITLTVSWRCNSSRLAVYRRQEVAFGRRLDAMHRTVCLLGRRMDWLETTREWICSCLASKFRLIVLRTRLVYVLACMRTCVHDHPHCSFPQPGSSVFWHSRLNVDAHKELWSRQNSFESRYLYFSTVLISDWYARSVFPRFAFGKVILFIKFCVFSIVNCIKEERICYKSCVCDVKMFVRRISKLSYWPSYDTTIFITNFLYKFCSETFENKNFVWLWDIY